MSHPPGDADLTWMVTRTDDNGSAYLVADKLTAGEARDMAAKMEARGHKQDYRTLGYPPGTRSSAMSREGVAE